MLAWFRSRPWRRSVESALADHQGVERARLAAQLWSQVMTRLQPQPAQKTAAQEDLARQVGEATHRYVDRALTEAVLGLRHLAALQDRVRWADYEDVPRLRAEAAWVELYLTRRLRSTWVRAAVASAAEGQLPKAEEICAAVAEKISGEVRSRALAA